MAFDHATNPHVAPQAIEILGLDPRPKGNSKSILTNKASGKPFVAGCKAEKEHEATVNMIAGLKWEGPPLEGPVVVSIEVRLEVPPIPKRLNASEKRIRAAWRLLALAGDVVPVKDEKHGAHGQFVVADRGNYLKMGEDALEGVCYVDDGNIVGGDVKKRWAPPGKGGWVVTVEPWSKEKHG